MDKCIVCDKQVFDYKPEMCCSGFECGCLGRPIEPPLCSAECASKIFGNSDNG